MEPIIITAPMNRICSEVIQPASMIGKKWHDDGNDYVMVSSII